MKLWEHAHKLLRLAQYKGLVSAFPEKNAKWHIRRAQRPMLLIDMDIRYFSFGENNGEDTLFGIPIEWTHENPPDTPEIRLSIEPLIGPRIFMDDPLKDIPQE